MQKNILYLTNIPSPYRVDFFNELGKHCKLTVLFEKKSSDEREANWNQTAFTNFEGIYLEGKSVAVDGAFCPGVVKYIKKGRYDHVFISNFSSPTGILAIETLRLKRIPYVLESDGGFAKEGKGLKSAIKTHIIKGAEAYFSTGAEHDRYYLAYGAEKEKIVRYPFTSIKEESVLQSILTSEEKAQLKKELGIVEEKCVLAIGQFIPRKGFDLLLQASKELDGDTGVYIVGGKPTVEYEELVEELQLKNVHFVGFVPKETVLMYLRAADVFAHPTREDIWGLVVNEALAQGTPVITTNRCIAGLELIQDEKTGYLIGVEDEMALAKGINRILADRKLRTRMSVNALTMMQDYTIEKMVERHVKFLNAFQVEC